MIFGSADHYARSALALLFCLRALNRGERAKA